MTHAQSLLLGIKLFANGKTAHGAQEFKLILLEIETGKKF